MKRHLIAILTAIVCLMSPSLLQAQFYTGMSGLIHTPSADMNRSGDFRIGGYFLNKHFTPDENFSYKGQKYNTGDFYLSLTPFSWIEIAYTFTLMKTALKGHLDSQTKPKYNNKDRYFSLKVNPLREGKYWPAVALGVNDFVRTPGKGSYSEALKVNGYFYNYYIALTKHFRPYGQDFSVNVAYRHYSREKNQKWDGIVGGVTWNPRWVKDLRIIAEYSGDDFNFGADYVLFKHVLLQAVMQEGKYFSGGICFQGNLF